MKNRLSTAAFLTAAFWMLISATDVAPVSTLPAVNTKEMLGKVDGIEIEAVVQSPSAQNTPLQVVCLFEYTEGDIFNSPPALPKEQNGMLHVDEALHGLITDLRKTHQFEGKSLETLLIIPPENSIAAKKLLLIGLGNRNDFKPELMRLIGITGMREALRLGVTTYSHASDLKDAGISSPTAEVAGYVIQGAVEAYRTQNYLKDRNASSPLTVMKVSLLTGQSFFEDSKKGIQDTLKKLTDSNVAHLNPHIYLKPPEINNVSPVIHEASSDARNATAGAISAGWATTDAPSLASCKAIEAPIPLDAPVTTATFPLSFCIGSPLVFKLISI